MIIKFFKDIKHSVFWIPFTLIIIAILLNFISPKYFNLYTFGINSWLVDKFGWGYLICGLGMVLLILIIFFSPFGRVKIGGPNAKPMLKNWQWFSITLCANVAVGLLFWGTAEPIYHMTSPPVSLGLKANTQATAVYSMSTMYLHWTITPFALYTVPALMFAFAYYNMKKPFSLSSAIDPVTRGKEYKFLGVGIDAICLFALCAGMGASLATGILTISGGISDLTGLKSNAFLWCIVGSIIIVSFILSSITGLNEFETILVVLLGGILFGITGLIFAVPVAAILKYLIPKAYSVIAQQKLRL